MHNLVDCFASLGKYLTLVAASSQLHSEIRFKSDDGEDLFLRGRYILMILWKWYKWNGTETDPKLIYETSLRDFKF